MSPFKIIAIDLDDTLLDDRLCVSMRNRRAIKRAVELGVVVTIATGRMFQSALPIVMDLEIEIPIITYQGALVKDIRSGEVLLNLPVPAELAMQVVEEGYKAGLHVNIYVNDRLYVDSITEEGKAYAKLAGVELNPVGNLISFLKEEPTKILFVGNPEFLHGLEVELQEKYGDKLYITKSKPNFLEFMHPGATKGKALRVLAQKYDVKPEEIMAFGDSYNDLDMIEFVGLGVAMGNAPEEIKQKADCVTGTNNADGVAQVIEKHLLEA